MSKTCDECGGAGTEDCPECGTPNAIDCEYCQGSGMVEEEEE